MEIDSFTIVMSIVFFTAMFGPVGYLLWRSGDRVAQMKTALKKLESENSLHFDHQDTWGERGIGLDLTNMKLLFVNLSKGYEAKSVIDLSRITYVEVVKGIDTISLLLEVGKHTSSFQTIELFNTKYDDVTESGFHNLLAIRWANTIKNTLKPMSRSPRKAA